MSCYRFEAARYLRERHLTDCNISGCPGCQPCTERHCQVCDEAEVTVDGRGSDQTCASCLSEARTLLGQIWDQAARLLGEAIRAGLINARAATLAGPAAAPETWGYRRMSVIAGRLDKSWLTEQGKDLADDDDPHPLWVLRTWDYQARDHLDQLQPPGQRPVTLTEARDYLDQHLTWLAHDETFDFAALHADLTRCHDHLTSVLTEHEEIPPTKGAPCPMDGELLVKDFGTEADDEVMWKCRRCDNWWTDEDYRSKILTIPGAMKQYATQMTASQFERYHQVHASTVRSWAKRERIAPVGMEQGHPTYDVTEVLGLRNEWESEKARRAAKRAAQDVSIAS